MRRHRGELTPPGSGAASPTRWLVASAATVTLLHLTALAGAQVPGRPALLEEVAALAAAHLARPSPSTTWPPALIEAVQRLAPPEPIDYYGTRGEAVIEEALTSHRPELLPRFRAWREARRVAATRAVVETLREALERYALDHGRYPPAPPGLAALRVVSASGGPYLGVGYVLEDGWGRPLVYRPRGERYELRSAGPDGRDGTADDVR